MQTASLHSTLPDGAGAPDWVHLLPAGTFRGRDGRGPYRLDNPAGVIAASMETAAVGKLPIDENHATDHAMQSGQPSPARGWIVELQARPDGIWGRVEWTPTGQEMMAERAYRGFSPVFAHDKAGRVVRLLRAALTNTPNLPDLHTLHSQGNPMDLAAQLRAALGLAEGADDGAILAAATANASAVAAHSAQMSAIATAAGIASGSAEEIVTSLQTLRATSVSSETVVSLQSQLNELRASTARKEAVAFVDGAISGGKPINALREHYIARHMLDAASVEKEINALISIHAGGGRAAGGNPEPDGDEYLSPEEMMAVQKMGLDPKAFRAQRKKMANDGVAA